MNKNNKVFHLNFELHTYDVDFRGKAHLHSLLYFLQEAAARHATLLGFGYDRLAPKKLTWLLSRYHLKINRYPRLGEKIEISTWPSGDQGVFALRDFQVQDVSGGLVLSATTSWVLWNIEKKQPTPVDEIKHQDVILPERALKDNFEPLPQLEEVDWEKEFPVLMRDLDLNRHVNNTVYIQWAIETLPSKILLSSCPTEVEISYKAEAFYGEKVCSFAQQIKQPGETNSNKLLFYHQIINKNKNMELARLRTRWGNST